MAFLAFSFSPLPRSNWLSILFLLLLSLLSFYLLFGKKKNNTKQSKPKLPPHPPRFPIIGNLHQLGKLTHQSLWELSKKHGPAMLLRLGAVPVLVVSSADMAKEVLKHHDIDCCNRPNSAGPRKLTYNFIDVAFSPFSEYWKEMRKIFSLELASAKRAEMFWRAREREIDRLIKFLEESSRNPVNLTERCFGVIDGIIGSIAFGRSYADSSKQMSEAKKFQRLLDEAMETLHCFAAEDFFPSVGWLVDILTGLRTKHDKCFRNIDGFFESVLEEHFDPARQKPEHEDLTDVLIGMYRDQTNVAGLTRTHIKAFLADTLLGGTDTSALTMIWTMTELMRNPRVRKKAQAEIRGVVGKKRRVDGDDLPKLKYLKMVMKENFRRHPPAPMLVPHETRNHCKIADTTSGKEYELLPRTRIFVNAWAIGRDPNTWTNPDEFYPERFEGSEIDVRGQHYELVPFGAGRRMCPAMTTGFNNVEFTLANLLYCFDWELPEGMKSEDVDLEEAGSITVHRKNPLIAIPIKYCL